MARIPELLEPLKVVVRHTRQRRKLATLRKLQKRCDAFLVSYPKSGRTWLRFLLSYYFAALRQNETELSLQAMFRILPNFDMDKTRGLPAYDFDSPKQNPLIAVSHLDYDTTLFGSQPVIFLVRDPRDVIVSAYFHASNHKKTFAGDIGEFLQDDKYGLAHLINYLNGWAEGLSGRSSVVLSYERMRRDTADTVIPILDLLGVKVDKMILERAVEAADFDRMGSLEKKEGIPGHEYDRSDPNSRRMRSGKVGSFSEVLSPNEAQTIVDRCRSELNEKAWEILQQCETM